MTAGDELLVVNCVAGLAWCFIILTMMPVAFRQMVTTFEWSMSAGTLIGGGVTIYIFFFESVPWLRQALREYFWEHFITLGLLIGVGISLVYTFLLLCVKTYRTIRG